MPIPQASRTPRLALRNGSPIILADASSSPFAAASSVDATRFKAIGYRQTMAPAAKGGKANANGFRFRNGGMRAMARTFRGKAFIGGHDWGDPRVRGGTIEDAYAEEMPGDLEMAIYFDIVAKAPWAIEGLKNGTIDRFSFGVQGEGEITCTVHNVPVWSTSECYCLPGESVLDEDGTAMVAEWEFEAGSGLELSAVNVPAVEGTGIVATSFAREVQSSGGRTALEHELLSQLCGRRKPNMPTLTASVEVDDPKFSIGDRVVAQVNHMPGMKGMAGKIAIARAGNPPYYGVRFDDQKTMPGTHKWLAQDELKAEGSGKSAMAVTEGVSSPAAEPITMTSQHEARAIMDRALICKSLGLPATATDEEILARTNLLAGANAQNEVLRTQLAEVGQREQTLAAERDAAHVESELTRLRASRVVGDELVTKLRAAAGTSRSAFDSTLAIVEMSAPAINAAPPIGSTPALQSATQPAAAPGALATFGAEGPDAFEANRTNANLPLLMKACGVSVDDVRKHGARKFTSEPKLEQLIKDTAERGDDMGTGPSGKQTFFVTNGAL